MIESEKVCAPCLPEATLAVVGSLLIALEQSIMPIKHYRLRTYFEIRLTRFN